MHVYWHVCTACMCTGMYALHACVLACMHVYWHVCTACMCTGMYALHACVQACMHCMHVYWHVFTACMCTGMYALHACVLACMHCMHVYWHVFTACMCTGMYALHACVCISLLLNMSVYFKVYHNNGFFFTDFLFVPCPWQPEQKVELLLHCYRSKVFMPGVVTPGAKIETICLHKQSIINGIMCYCMISLIIVDVCT